MPTPATPPPARRVRDALAGTVVLALALPLVMALWSAAALWWGAPVAWMAVIAAADASLLLGLLRVPPGRLRVGLALGFLGVCTAASLWLVVAGQVGLAFGLPPWESALRLGPVLFGSIAGPWINASTLGWGAAAVALAVWWNRR